MTMGNLELEAAQQQTPPPPSAPRPVRIPKPQESTLPNGLRVIVVEKRDMPLVSARLLVRSGAETDPADASGLAEMTADLVTKGTTKRTAPEIAQAIESLGGSLESGASWDFSNVYVNVLSSKFEPALAVLADVVRNASFNPEEIERVRQQTLDSIKVSMGQPSAVGSMVAARAVFGDQPYGHPRTGTPESLARIKREDIVRLHRELYRPGNAILVIGGDIDAPAAFALAGKLFGDWETAAAPPIADKPAGSPVQAPRGIVIDMPQSGQAAVVTAIRGLSRTDPSYFPGIVTNSVLGGGYSARLNQEIRIKRGLSYGASSRLETRREPGPFIASTQTKNEAAGQVASLMLEQLKRLENEPVPEAELTPRKAVLIGNFGRNLERIDGVVAQLASLALYGLDLDEINHYIEKVQAVTAPQVQEFARTHLQANDAKVVVVGESKLFLEELRKVVPELQVIPISDLDLNNMKLQR
jgi:zinc protease